MSATTIPPSTLEGTSENLSSNNRPAATTTAGDAQAENDDTQSAATPASPPTTPGGDDTTAVPEKGEEEKEDHEEDTVMGDMQAAEDRIRKHSELTASAEMFALQLAQLSEAEAISRSEGVMREETHVFASLLGEAAVGRETAERVTKLTQELAALTQDHDELGALNDASSTLLSFLSTTTSSLEVARAALEEEAHDLAVYERRLEDARRRLTLLPAADHADVEAALTDLESIVSGGATGETTQQQQQQQGDDAPDASAPPSLTAIWNNTAAVAMPTSATATANKEFLRSQVVGEWDAAFDTLVDLNNVKLRHEHARTRHRQICLVISTLLRNHELRQMESHDQKDALTRELDQLLDKELAALEGPRKQLKQIEEEQLYHIRRGTFIKERQNKITHDKLLAERVKGRHNHLCEDMIRVQSEIDVVSNEVRNLRRSLDDMKRCAQIDVDALEKRRAELQGDADSAMRSRLALETEAEDLRSLKHDVTKVLQFVRLKHKSA